MSNSVYSVSSYILVLRLFTSPNPNPIYMVILCFLRNVSLQKLWRGKGSWRNILVGRNLVIAACSECNTVAKVISSLDANFAAFVMTIVTNYKFTFAGELECCSALRNSILRQKSGHSIGVLHNFASWIWFGVEELLGCVMHDTRFPCWSISVRPILLEYSQI